MSSSRTSRPLSAEEEAEIESIEAYLVMTHSAMRPAAPSPSPLSNTTTAEDDLPLYALPDQVYLERTVLPLLLRGLEELALARPPDPLAFLGAYLLSNNPQRAVHANGTSATSEEAEKGEGEPTAAMDCGSGAETTAGARRLFHGVADRTEVAAIAAAQFEPA